MSSAYDLRQKFEKSDFFKKIAKSGFGLNIAGQSGTFYGINNAQGIYYNSYRHFW